MSTPQHHQNEPHPQPSPSLTGERPLPRDPREERDDLDDDRYANLPCTD